jgi:acyl-lipid omega-6 desaturase (Delta-12 desaturase)
MFGIGPVFAMVVGPRIVARNARPRMRRSVIGTDLLLATIIASLCWLIGWRDFLLTWAPAALLAGAAGIWLFYVQHQFEHTYWQRSEGWSYTDAALRGSSYHEGVVSGPDGDAALRRRIRGIRHGGRPWTAVAGR